MVLIVILPLEHETLLVVGIVRPSVKLFVRPRSIDPMVETAPHLAFSLLFEPAKHHARINIAIPRTRQECNRATGGRLNPVNQPNRVGTCGHVRRYASTVTTLAKTKPLVNMSFRPRRLIAETFCPSSVSVRGNHLFPELIW